LERYADGLAAGTSGLWPRIENRGQPLVEAASIALRLRRPLLGTGWTTWCGSGRRPGSATC
jgi:hypothetical protein